MATIQIRNVPEDVHRVYQLRAAAAGQSLQEYLRSELIANARTAAPAEIVAEVESKLREEEGEGFAGISSAPFVDEDRESH
ncbi:MAG: antitoxin [Acidimicrobiia bacterium]